jgi:GDP-mannose transporter
MADDKKREEYAIEMGDRKESSFDRASSPMKPPTPRRSASHYSVAESPILPVISYCVSSILMTVTNKYVLSGLDFNLNFFLLCVQVGFATPRGVLWYSNRYTVRGLCYCYSEL